MTDAHRIYEIRTPMAVPETEFDKTFVQGMADRMAVGFFKYGRHADSEGMGVDFLESLKLRLAAYEETGNTEFLMDVANIAMIEFLHPSVEGAYFEATDSDQSPGRVAPKPNVMGGVTKRVTQAHNKEL